MPGHDGQGDRVPPQDPVQTVVRRYHVEQPADRGGLELLAARRVHPGRPPRRYICAHLDSLPDYRTHILSRAEPQPDPGRAAAWPPRLAYRTVSPHPLSDPQHTHRRHLPLPQPRSRPHGPPTIRRGCHIHVVPAAWMWHPRRMARRAAEITGHENLPKPQWHQGLAPECPRGEDTWSCGGHSRTRTRQLA